MPFLPRNPEHHTADVIALHRATLENPFDDTPHLVYADAMDDAGAHDEAHTLRRLVKLRAAIGEKALRPIYEPPDAADRTGMVFDTASSWVCGDGTHDDKGEPHIQLLDAAVPVRTAKKQHLRMARFVRQVSGLDGVAVRYKTARGEWFREDIIHGPTVVTLLGEHDAQ